jgi:hypothetical protein
LHHPQICERSHFEIALQLLRREIDNGREGRGRIESIVNQDVDPPVGSDNFLYCRFGPVRITDVANNPKGRAPCGLDVRYYSPHIGCGPREHSDRCALCRKQLRGRAANATPGTSHDATFPLRRAISFSIS